MGFLYNLLLVLLLRLRLDFLSWLLHLQTILILFRKELSDIGLLPQSLCLLFLFFFEFSLLFGQFKLLFLLYFFKSLLFFEEEFVLAGLLLCFKLGNLIQSDSFQLGLLLLFLLFSLELCLDFLLLFLFKLNILLLFGLKFLSLLFCFNLQFELLLTFFLCLFLLQLILFENYLVEFGDFLFYLADVLLVWQLVDKSDNSINAFYLDVEFLSSLFFYHIAFLPQTWQVYLLDWNFPEAQMFLW